MIAPPLPLARALNAELPPDVFAQVAVLLHARNDYKTRRGRMRKKEKKKEARAQRKAYASLRLKVPSHFHFALDDLMQHKQQRHARSGGGGGDCLGAQDAERHGQRRHAVDGVFRDVLHVRARRRGEEEERDGRRLKTSVAPGKAVLDDARHEDRCSAPHSSDVRRFDANGQAL